MLLGILAAWKGGLVDKLLDGLAELFLPFEGTLPDGAAAEALKSFEGLLGALEGEDALASEAAMAELHGLLWAAIRRMTRNAA